MSSLAPGNPKNHPAPAPTPRRGRFSLFATPEDATAATDPAEDDERGELVGDGLLAAARARHIDRKAWRLTHDERPLPAIDADGHVIVPAETLAKQAAEAAEAEAERLAGLTPGRLDAAQTRRWVDWLHEYELHRPTSLRLGIGPRGEMYARAQFAPYVWEDDDERHPDGSHIVVSGLGGGGAVLPDQPKRPDVRAYPNARVLDAIRTQLLSAWWLPEESNKPTPPTPLTIDERLAAMTAEREARAAAQRRPDHNRRLILGGGRGW